jgi:hypothetical protein
MQRAHVNVNFQLLLLVLLITLSFGDTASAQTTPSYSVTVSGGNFNPNPICKGTPGTANVTGSLNIQNPNVEYSINGQNWSWSLSVTGFSSTSTGTYGAVPDNPPSVIVSGNGSSIEVMATASSSTEPGYYTINVTGTDSFTQMGPNKDATQESPCASTTLYLCVFSASVIEDNPVAAVDYIGAEDVFVANIEPADLRPSITWTVPPSTTVKSSMVSTNGEYIQLGYNTTVNGDSVVFNWLAPGSATISANISVGSAECTASDTVSVLSPSIAASSTSGVVGVDTAYAAGIYASGGGGNPNSTWIHDGLIVIIDSYNYAGMVVKASPPLAPANSILQWVQLVNSASATYTTTTGHTWRVSVAPGLDTYFPYPWEPNVPPYQTGDSPGFQLSPTTTPDADPGTSFGASESFSDWLEFNPGTMYAIFVPLETQNWSWNGQANCSSSYWSLTASSNPPPSLTTTTSYPPAWSGLATVGQWTKQ